VALPVPLAARSSVFWSDRRGVPDSPGPTDRLTAVDRLDLRGSGRLLHGRDRRTGAPARRRKQLIEEVAPFARDRFRWRLPGPMRPPAALVADGRRTTTKAVLLAVRFRYPLATQVIGLNSAAASWYREDGAHREITRAAVGWCEDGSADPVTATALPEDHLTGLYPRVPHRLRRGADRHRSRRGRATSADGPVTVSARSSDRR
jgi:hypothetical protein